MSESTELRFRTAVGGFHKSDVTEYITKTAARHKAELSKLEAENQQLRNQLEESANTLHALEQILEEAVHPAAKEPISDAAPETAEDTITSLELAAYRRAEHAERTANNRAKQLYQQLDQIGLESQDSLSAAREATQEVLNQLSVYLEKLQAPYQSLVNQLGTARARLEALADMNPDPAEGMEDPHE